jgi:hypothetical protein
MLVRDAIASKVQNHISFVAVIHLTLSQFPSITFSWLVDHGRQTRLINRADLLFSATIQTSTRYRTSSARPLRIGQLGLLIRQQGIRYEIHSPPPRVEVDQEMIIISFLLGNYTPPSSFRAFFYYFYLRFSLLNLKPSTSIYTLHIPWRKIHKVEEVCVCVCVCVCRTSGVIKEGLRPSTDLTCRFAVTCDRSTLKPSKTDCHQHFPCSKRTATQQHTMRSAPEWWILVACLVVIYLGNVCLCKRNLIYITYFYPFYVKLLAIVDINFNQTRHYIILPVVLKTGFPIWHVEMLEC